MTNIEQFTQQLMLAHDIEYIEAHNRAYDFYNKLKNETPSIFNDGWISVCNGFPNKSDDYIVWVKGMGIYLSYFSDGTFMEKNITHWQALPQPPKD